MRYMNDYDLDVAVSRFTRSSTPNRLAVALLVRNLAQWADDNSDGWAYWVKPLRAAQPAMDLIYGGTWTHNEEQEANDVSDATVAAVARPVKAFLTRVKATPDARERILRSVTN